MPALGGGRLHACRKPVRAIFVMGGFGGVHLETVFNRCMFSSKNRFDLVGKKRGLRPHR